ncbi:hypothetical protein CVT26_012308 [Gymnopilus dilepis]|uniref:Uncharacterized protein n=1 Tax=Gymnopilus dilepis TaxID=231916 RepID=A0A409YCL7_9AGAR|nr:hypothetical protein CVT26_012308 [Gymnopilus dilepis]
MDCIQGPPLTHLPCPQSLVVPSPPLAKGSPSPITAVASCPGHQCFTASFTLSLCPLTINQDAPDALAGCPQPSFMPPYTSLEGSVIICDKFSFSPLLSAANLNSTPVHLLLFLSSLTPASLILPQINYNACAASAASLPSSACVHVQCMCNLECMHDMALELRFSISISFSL